MAEILISILLYFLIVLLLGLLYLWVLWLVADMTDV